MKALQKKPERRYATARELGDDIERHLASQPISARRDSLAYRAQRFVKRNLVAVAASFAVVVFGVAQTVLYTNRLKSARDAASLEADKAQRVTAFLSDVFSETDPNRSRGDPITARELLERGVARIEEELSDQPETQAYLYRTMGKTYSSRGLLNEARPLLEKSLALHREHLGEAHYETYRSLLELGVLGWRQGKYVESEQHLIAACDLAARILGPDDDQTLGCRSNLGLAIYRQSRFEEALTIQAGVVKRTRQLGLSDSPVFGKRLNNLAGVYLMTDNYEQAVAVYTEALATNRKHYGREHPASLDTLNNLAMATHGLERLDDAARLYREVIELRTKVLGKDHPRTVGSMFNLADLQLRRYDLAAAIDLYSRVLASRQRTLGADHHDTLITMRTLGDALVLAKRFDEAGPLVLSARARLSETLGANHLDTLMAEQIAGEFLWETGARSDALVAFGAAASGLPSVAGPNSDNALLARLRLTQALFDHGEHADAYTSAADLREQMPETGIYGWLRGLILAEYARNVAHASGEREAAEIFAHAEELLVPYVEEGDTFVAKMQDYYFSGREGDE